MKHTLYKTSCVLVVVATLATAAPASAASATETLARMDVIILEMQKLRAEFAALLASPGASQSPTPGAVLGAGTTSILTDDLSYGVTNASIEKIQKLMATDSEIYPDGTISGFFGPKTQDALRRFQVRFGLDPVGVVGPSTKAIFEAFMAKYPNDTYPTDVLKGSVPQVGVAPSTPVPTTPTTPQTPVVAGASTGKTVTSISLDSDDGEVLVHSRNSDGTRNRDLVLYPEDEEELVEQIAAKLKISETLVRSLADLDDADLDGGRADEEEEANDALDEAEEMIDEAEEAIEAAEEGGEDTSEAEDLLDEAYDALDEAEEAFDDEDYEDAIDLAEEAAELAEEAIDEL